MALKNVNSKIIIIIFIFGLKEFILFNSKYFQLMKGKKYISECFETTDLGFETEFNNIKPKVSVIIPVFNCQNTIRSSIISIQKQTLKEIEIILVNDFSLDGSKEIIENIQKDDPRIVIINNNKNMGTLYSRNIGAFLANGKYIFPLDNDDLIFDKNIILRLYNIAEKYNYDIIEFKAIDAYNYNSKINEMFEDPFITNKDKRIIYQPELKFLSLNNNDCHIWGKYIKHEIYKKAISLFYDKRNINYICVAEDDIMVFMLFSVSLTFYFFPIYGIFHLISNETASFTLPKDHLVFSRIYFLDILFDFSENNNEEKEYIIKNAKSFHNYLILKNLTFSQQNKLYLGKVLKKIFNCNYISTKHKNLLKIFFNF